MLNFCHLPSYLYLETLFFKILEINLKEANASCTTGVATVRA